MQDSAAAAFGEFQRWSRGRVHRHASNADKGEILTCVHARDPQPRSPPARYIDANENESIPGKIYRFDKLYLSEIPYRGRESSIPAILHWFRQIKRLQAIEKKKRDQSCLRFREDVESQGEERQRSFVVQIHGAGFS